MAACRLSAKLERATLERAAEGKRENLERAMLRFEGICRQRDTGAVTQLQVLVEMLEKDLAGLCTAREVKQQELRTLQENFWRQREEGWRQKEDIWRLQRPASDSQLIVTATPSQEMGCTIQTSASANRASSDRRFPDQNRHCTAYPHCNCIKARGPQVCKLARFGGCSVREGDCIFRRGKAGWGHCACAIMNPE